MGENSKIEWLKHRRTDPEFVSLRLPKANQQRLDAEGRQRGLTWRQMPGGNAVIKAVNWWLWKRGHILNWKAESAAAQTHGR